MEVGELDLNGGGQVRRAGVDDHCHHLGVDEGGVAVEEENIAQSVSSLWLTAYGQGRTMKVQVRTRGVNVQGVRRHLVMITCISKRASWIHVKAVKVIKLPLEGQNRGKVSVKDDAGHKSIVAIWKERKGPDYSQIHKTAHWLAQKTSTSVSSYQLVQWTGRHGTRRSSPQRS